MNECFKSTDVRKSTQEKMHESLLLVKDTAECEENGKGVSVKGNDREIFHKPLEDGSHFLVRISPYLFFGCCKLRDLFIYLFQVFLD